MEMNRTNESVEALRRKVVIGGGASLHDEQQPETVEPVSRNDDRARSTRDAERGDEPRSRPADQ